MDHALNQSRSSSRGRAACDGSIVFGDVSLSHLYTDCKLPTGSQSLCYAYIAGSFDAGDTFNALQPRYCLPDEVQLQQVHDVVTNYLEARPEMRSEAGGVLVLMALSDAWPC